MPEATLPEITQLVVSVNDLCRNYCAAIEQPKSDASSNILRQLATTINRLKKILPDGKNKIKPVAPQTPADQISINLTTIASWAVINLGQSDYIDLYDNLSQIQGLIAQAQLQK